MMNEERDKKNKRRNDNDKINLHGHFFERINVEVRNWPMSLLL